MMETGMWNQAMEKDPESVREIWNSAGFTGEPFRIPEGPGDLGYEGVPAGFTPSEWEDVRTSEEPPKWFIEKTAGYLRENEELEKFLLVDPQDMTDEEEEALTVGASRERASGVIRIPENRLEESPEFKERIEQEWLSLRRNPRQNGASLNGMSGTVATPFDYIENSINKTNVTFDSKAELENFARMKNEELKEFDKDLSTSALNYEIERYWNSIPVELNKEEITDASSDIISFMEEDLGNINDNNFKEWTDRFIRYVDELALDENWSETSRQRVIENFVENYTEQFEEKYFSGLAKNVAGFGTSGAVGGGAVGAATTGGLGALPGAVIGGVYGGAAGAGKHNIDYVYNRLVNDGYTEEANRLREKYLNKQ
jgi:hypothetical protein